MRNGVETRLDGTTLVVRIPMRFRHRGGRKRIVAPDGSEVAPAPKPQPDGRLCLTSLRGRGRVAGGRARSGPTYPGRLASHRQADRDGSFERDVSWWHGAPVRCGAATVANRLVRRSSRKKAPVDRDRTGTLGYYFGPAPSARVPTQGTRSIPTPHSANYVCEAPPSQTTKIGAALARAPACSLCYSRWHPAEALALVGGRPGPDPVLSSESKFKLALAGPALPEDHHHVPEIRLSPVIVGYFSDRDNRTGKCCADDVAA
jgi:hypothetical protein